MSKTITRTRGARKIVPCKKKATSKTKVCAQCKKKIATDELYWDFGLRATTMHERNYSRGGLIWYQYCEKCSFSKKEVEA